MDEKMKAKLDEYVGLLGELKAKVQDEQTAARILSEIARDLRMEQISRERGRSPGSNGLATSAQLGYLKRLNVQVTPGLTKQQASALIDAELEKGTGDEDETVSAVSSHQDVEKELGKYVHRVEKARSLPFRKVTEESVPEYRVMV